MKGSPVAEVMDCNMPEATSCTTEPQLGALSTVQGDEPQLPVPGQVTGSLLLPDTKLDSHVFSAHGQEALCSHAGSGASANLTELGLTSW